MFKLTQLHAKRTQQDDLANDKASTVAVLADVEQWGSNNYDEAGPAMHGSSAYHAMEYAAG
jgi:hypothetical protein